MRTVGIIAEYNPFHNGHRYQLDLVRNQQKADYIVVVMSGDFLQRGMPALCDKKSRAECAVRCGADLVLELPACFATADAPLFCRGGVALLDHLQVVDLLAFGSECGDLSLLWALADLIRGEAYQQLYLTGIKEGLSSPDSRLRAVQSCLSDMALSGIVNEPNNLLGVYYLMALKLLGSSIRPTTHMRQGQAYLDSDLPDDGQLVFASATAVRRCIENAARSEKNDVMPPVLARYLPGPMVEHLTSTYGSSVPVFAADFFPILCHRLSGASRLELTEYVGIDDVFAGHILRCFAQTDSFEALTGALAAYAPLTRVCRTLFRILIDQRKSAQAEYLDGKIVHYTRVLAKSANAGPLLKKIRATCRIPLLDIGESMLDCEGSAFEQYHNDYGAEVLYQSVVHSKFA